MKVIVLILSFNLFLNNVDTFRFRTSKNRKEQQELLNLASKLEKEFTNEYKSFKQTGIQSVKYERILEKLQAPPQIFRRNEIEEMSEQKQDVTCLMCRAVVNTFLDYRRKEKYDEEQLLDEAVELCLSLNIQPETVCESIIRMHLPPLMYIVDNRPELTAKSFCGFILQSSSCELPQPDFDFTIDVDNNFPTHVSDKKNEVEENYRVLHITDIHYDPKYTPGSNAQCDEPTCCRGDAPDTKADAAGFWGDYRNCDAPWHSIVEVMKHLNETHEFDWIYYTGDIVDHGVWETSIEGNIEIMEKVYQLMKETFPNTPLYPALGNHETHPVNVFSPPEIKDDELSTDWLFKYTAKAWSDWLPNDTMPSIERGGYYTILIRPGLRLITLNNNDCYVYNWWTFYSTDSQVEQLQWLHDILLQSEQAKENVHILAHIPPGEGSCFKIWSREYRRIIERFSYIIKAQFHGHTHYDEFNVFYGRDNEEIPIGVAWNGGSVSPYSDVNPNYVIYDIGKSSFVVNNFESWGYNLTEANLNTDNRPKWIKYYSFKDIFNLPDLSATSLDQLIHRFALDKELLFNFWKLKIKNGDPFLKEGCNRKCLTSCLCEIVTNETGDNRKCDYFTTIMNSTFVTTS